MKVIIDGTGLIAGTGISTYIRSLLAQIARIDRKNEYIVFAAFFNDFERKKALLKISVPQQDNFSLDCRKIPESMVLFLEHTARIRIIEHLIDRHHADIFHGTGNLLPIFKHTPSVLTAHHFYTPGDPLFPVDVSCRERAYFRATEDAIRDATRIMADSRFTAGVIGHHFPDAREKTSVIYPGISENFPDNDPGSLPLSVPEKYGIHGPYIYCSGPLNERKNIKRLIEAFTLLRERGRKETLFISGFNESPYARELKHQWEVAGLGNAVVAAGYIPRGELPAVYKAARVFVYPSLLEGFGLPPLEAMSCGCPVAASQAASIPEAVGNAGLLFNPLDPASIADALETILGNEDLRTELVSRGHERCRLFSWEHTVLQTLGVYREILKGESPG